jgi:hypothetical protein
LAVRLIGGGGAGTPQPRPERRQGLDALAVADEDDGAAQQIQHHGDGVVPLADGDLVDGDLLVLVQLGLAEAPRQGAGSDVLDGVPADLEMLGHVLDGHVPRQIEGVALEGAGVVLIGFGEAQLDLAHAAAGEAQDARHLELEQHGLGADRHGAEGALGAAQRPVASLPQQEQRRRSRGLSMRKITWPSSKR